MAEEAPGPYRDARHQADVQRCCFGDDDRGYCGEPAVEHIYISIANGGPGTMACERHKAWFDTHPCDDRHPVAGPCGLPGTTWIYSTEDYIGWCEFDGFSGLETAIAEAELADHREGVTADA